MRENGEIGYGLVLILVGMSMVCGCVMFVVLGIILGIGCCRVVFHFVF